MATIPSKEQLQRLKNLQGTDAGIFTLAVFSVMEAFLRHKLGHFADSKTTFYQLLQLYRDKFGRGDREEFSLFKQIAGSQSSTNLVRHQFKPLSVEEARGAVFLLRQFATMENVPNFNEIEQLTSGLQAWEHRLSPAETARELTRTINELKLAVSEKKDLALQVQELNGLKEDYEVLQWNLKVQTADFDKLIEKNKSNQEKIDRLRKEKNQVQEEIRKTEKILQEKIHSLADAELYLSNLVRMTSYTRTRFDYEQSLIKLTSQQSSVVNMVTFGKDFLIKGSAGTGKSLVLLKTLEKLITEKPDVVKENQRVKLVTFTRSLEKYNRYVADLLKITLEPEGQDKKAEDFIATTDSLVMAILQKAFPDISFCYDLRVSLPEDFLALHGNCVLPELEKFILPNVVTREEYCEKRISRKGMKNSQKQATRKEMWSVIENIFDFYEKSSVQPVLYGIYKLLGKLEKGEYTPSQDLCVDFLFVDEVQDLTAGTLKLLHYFVTSCMILAGDNDQAVFQPGFSWKRAGICLQGSTRTLNLNFRSTNQINEIAEKYRALTTEWDKSNRPETFRLGPPVELHEGKNQEDTFQQLVSVVKLCLTVLCYEAENLCIIAPRKTLLESLREKLKKEINADSEYINSENFAFSAPGVIRLATPQSCKGLDFPVVLFYLDHRAHFLNVFDDKVADKMNRNMIYTALTRSIELLHVFIPESSTSEPVDDLRKILKDM